MFDTLSSLSEAFASRVAAASSGLVSVHAGTRPQRTATLWRPGVLVTSEQGLPADPAVPVTMGDGSRARAMLVGRDAGTNVAVLRCDLEGPALPDPAEPSVGGLGLILGAASDGSPTARLAMVHRVGPAWDSPAGSRIEQLIILDARLSARNEGGLVLDAGGGLLGMATLGPRRRVLVIPALTVNRVLAPLLADSYVSRGSLGAGLQAVSIPPAWQGAAGVEAGLMVISLTAREDAEAAGVLLGDILLEVDGTPVLHPRTVTKALQGGSVGRTVTFRLLRGGRVLDLPIVIRDASTPR